MNSFTLSRLASFELSRVLLSLLRFGHRTPFPHISTLLIGSFLIILIAGCGHSGSRYLRLEESLRAGNAEAADSIVAAAEADPRLNDVVGPYTTMDALPASLAPAEPRASTRCRMLSACRSPSLRIQCRVQACSPEAAMVS